jgi:hypothetical protein
MVRMESASGNETVWPGVSVVCDAGGDVGFLVGRGALDQVALVLHLPAARVIEGEVRGDLAPVLLDLLAEAGRAAALEVEAGLEAIHDGEEHVDRADRIGRGRDPDIPADLIELEDRDPGGEDAPVDGKAQCLVLRVGEG